MAVKDMSYRERGLLLSMFAHQCYSEPNDLLKKRPGIKDLAPLKKFLRGARSFIPGLFFNKSFGSL